ncbi:3-phenylpropionate/cinnamic acid dioxygenase small subunit [Kitasatospora sp. MAA4]|uniref:nuclear transport factor 2 family protein n=1 Tax=Kitasatospora sp. MAA4 TaxID=3035093 RepID=UPI00247337E4|nr:nuclear transport factor 2 family protein [Kitasatospora sp. MAA4]MDH6132399.1 3-phenylpropionate/cinnamic acid dioxygenase small subunit [Kitasatospora sp. MAA4]
MTYPAPPDAPPIAAEDYAQILAFYAAQVRLLDQGRADEFAEQFTEDGVFGQNVKPEPKRGRQEIADSMRRGMAVLAERGLTRRHWFGMVSAGALPDGAVRTEYYAMVYETPRGGTASVYLSTTAEDELVQRDGRWLVRSRHVTHDGT